MTTAPSPGCTCSTLTPHDLCHRKTVTGHVDDVAHGAPYESDYFIMIVGLYAVLGAFLCNAARRPEAHVSLIWFTVWSSVVHAAIMAVQSFTSAHQRGHLVGDVPALLLAALVLAVLLKTSGVSPGGDRA